MDAIENLMTRRSVRRFTDRRISLEDLETITNAARMAPSGMNRQLWKFTVLKNKELMTELAHRISDSLGRDYQYNFYGPDTLILVSNAKDNPHGQADCACALENIFLAAHALGIGSVLINQLNGICDEPAVRAVLTKLQIPENHIVWGMAALGYAEDKSAAADKKPAAETVGWIL